LWKVDKPENATNVLYVPLASDRGLCGAVNSISTLLSKYFDSLWFSLLQLVVLLATKFFKRPRPRTASSLFSVTRPKEVNMFLFVSSRINILLALERMFGNKMVESISEMNKFKRIPYKQVSMVADHLLAQDYERGVV
jgi:hypothetical protein